MKNGVSHPISLAAGANDHEHHDALQPVADEKSDDLAGRRAEEPHASAGRRMSAMATREAAK